MLYKQVTYLPIIFKVDEGIINDIPALLSNNSFLFKNILVVSGSNFSKVITEGIIRNTDWSHQIIVNNSNEIVEDLKQLCLRNRYDLLIGIGGGSVLDVVKRVSLLSQINHIAVPTIISNDGLISPISVIKNGRGISESLSGEMPMGVVIDLDIIQTSPEKYLKAAAGDILSNTSATNDWILSNVNTGEKINDLAFLLSRGASSTLVNFNKLSLSHKPFIRQIVQGQINSGLAMSLAGTSRPCSGSEHLISHAIDAMGLSTNTLHGAQVASISLFSLFLQKKLQVEYIRYLEEIGIPCLFHEFDENIYSNLKEIYKVAKLMRPGRFTVLDLIDEDSFISEYDSFVKLIEENKP